MLKSTYFPRHTDNRMQHEGDVRRAREHFLNHRPANLAFLLAQRFEWMNTYLDGREQVIEVGAGAGFSRLFIRNPHLKLTDYHREHPWIDEAVDAMAMPYADNSLDAVISSHMIHHLANPLAFFREVQRVLKPGGLLVIHDLHTSLLLRLVLRVMRHEGYSYNVDVLAEDTVANDPQDPWSANCAIPGVIVR